VQPQPATLDRELEAGAILGWRGLMLRQHRPVDYLDMNAAALRRINRIGDLKQLARSGPRDQCRVDQRLISCSLRPPTSVLIPVDWRKVDSQTPSNPDYGFRIDLQFGPDFYGAAACACKLRHISFHLH
jgi:hypothetical protein